ncbi:MAG: Crp/Fnr family transcriptional regulator [Byssovorax sp.]
MANDTLSELDARKRRIIRRGTVGNAASQASLGALMEAGTIQRIEKGHLLVTQGESASHVAMIGMGRVRLTRAMGDGRSLALGYRGAGDLLGEAALGGVSAHRESAVAAEDVEALMVPVTVIRAIMGVDQPFAVALLTVMVERQHDTEERLASMLFRNVEARLAELLLKASARWGVPDPRGTMITAAFTHQEMANMIGSTRETVTLTLGDLRRKSVIDIDRRRIVVLDKEALKTRV